MKMNNAIKIMSLALLLIAGSSVVAADSEDNQIATLRQGTLLNKEAQDPARLSNPANKDQKRERAYPMQPPTIPHKIDNYQVDTKANKCMSCHARTRTLESQAPMVSVTHFMDRDGNFLANVSPRRYFCTQCHVTQLDAKPLLKNTFIPVDELIENKANKK